jgi:tRNA(Ile)-lysidine synthase
MAAAPHVAVATSGGRDSTALLHCTVQAARRLGVEVVALHVHHGLMAEADAWLDSVRRQAVRWGAGFDARRLAAGPPAGASVEAWARTQRYAALAEMACAGGIGIVLLAHHRRDQAETFLLQALRGGAPAGLASMPRLASRDGIVWARPWLDQPRAAIDAYVRRHRLRHVEDASNVDERFARSRLRTTAWPALAAAFPDAETCLSNAAARAWESATLANEVAALDLPVLVRRGASSGAGEGANGALDVRAWAALPPARRNNALRAWLAVACIGAVPQSLVQRLLQELPRHAGARWPAPGGELRLQRGWLSGPGTRPS